MRILNLLKNDSGFSHSGWTKADISREKAAERLGYNRMY